MCRVVLDLYCELLEIPGYQKTPPPSLIRLLPILFLVVLSVSLPSRSLAMDYSFFTPVPVPAQQPYPLFAVASTTSFDEMDVSAVSQAPVCA